MGLTIIKAGLLDAVQDLGRHGRSDWGINPGGCMDRYAARVANALVGNDLNEAVIEIHFPACQIRFEQDMLISITGADFIPCINDTNISLWKPIYVKKGAMLLFKRRRHGTRCYISMRGGVNVPLWLGSASTNLKTARGGFSGRALRKGDTILLKSHHVIGRSMHIDVTELPWSINPALIYGNDNTNTTFFVEGNEFEWLSHQSRQQMLNDEFLIDASSDRMGFHLKHLPLKYQYQEELLSSAVTFGTIQGLPNGNLVVLMADHQTTGGYPRIGHVITAHLPRLSQRSPGEAIRFQKISVTEAEKILFSLENNIKVLQRSCRQKLESYYAEH